jgi:hypothetical protein
MKLAELGLGYLTPRFLLSNAGDLPPGPHKPQNFAEMIADVTASCEEVNAHILKAGISSRLACEKDEQSGFVVKIYLDDVAFPVASITDEGGVPKLIALSPENEEMGFDEFSSGQISDRLAALLEEKFYLLLEDTPLQVWRDYIWDIHETLCTDDEEYLNAQQVDMETSDLDSADLGGQCPHGPS